MIVGQDPYHGPGQAHGLCFSVQPGQRPPPSLKNICKELQNDCGIDVDPHSGHLIQWANRGVLLLNNVLTVRRGQAGSHHNQGWEAVTDDILRALLDHHSQTKKGLVFLLWGKPAAKKAQTVLAKHKFGRKQNSKEVVIITTSHPSPLGAYKTKEPFMGSKCFSRCNAALEKMGHERIDWNLS